MRICSPVELGSAAAPGRAFATLTILAFIALGAAGCVQSQASKYERLLRATIPASDQPSHEVAMAFGLHRSAAHEPVALTVVAE